MKWFIGMCVPVCILFAQISAAIADEPTAERLFWEGLKKLEDLDYSGAADDFEKSYMEYPNKQSLFNLALCYFELSQHFQSLKAFGRLLKEFKDNLAKEKIIYVQSKIDAIKALLPSIHVVTEPDGATVTIDEESAGETPLNEPVFLAEGDHSITIFKEGYETIVWKGTFTAGTREKKSFALKMIEDPVPPLPMPIVEPIPIVSVRKLQLEPRDKPKPNIWSPLFITGLTGTVVTAGVSIGLWAAGGHLYGDYEDMNARLKEMDDAGQWDDNLEAERDDAENSSWVFNKAAVATTVAVGAFVVLTATAVILNTTKKKESAVSLLPGGVEVRF